MKIKILFFLFVYLAFVPFHIKSEQPTDKPMLARKACKLTGMIQKGQTFKKIATFALVPLMLRNPAKFMQWAGGLFVANKVIARLLSD